MICVVDGKKCNLQIFFIVFFVSASNFDFVFVKWTLKDRVVAVAVISAFTRQKKVLIALQKTHSRIRAMRQNWSLSAEWLNCICIWHYVRRECVYVQMSTKRYELRQREKETTTTTAKVKFKMKDWKHVNESLSGCVAFKCETNKRSVDESRQFGLFSVPHFIRFGQQRIIVFVSNQQKRRINHSKHAPIQWKRNKNRLRKEMNHKRMKNANFPFEWRCQSRNCVRIISHRLSNRFENENILSIECGFHRSSTCNDVVDAYFSCWSNEWARTRVRLHADESKHENSKNEINEVKI